MPLNKQILLVSRPQGEATVDNFRLVETQTPALAEGQVLVSGSRTAGAGAVEGLLAQLHFAPLYPEAEGLFRIGAAQITAARAGFARAHAAPPSAAAGEPLSEAQLDAAAASLSGLALWPRLQLDAERSLVVQSRGALGEHQSSHWQTALPLLSSSPGRV